MNALVLVAALVTSPPVSSPSPPAKVPRSTSSPDAAALSPDVRAPVIVVLPWAGADNAFVAALRASFGALGATVLDGAATESLVTAASALGLACRVESPGCAVQLGGIGAADLVVAASMSTGNAGVTVEARLLDVNAVKERRRASVVLGEVANRARDAKLLAVRLLAPERETGRIVVHASPDGAAVLVDGVVRTATHAIEVKPGKHDVYVGKPGFDGVAHSVDVGFDGEASLDVTLTPLANAADAKPVPFAMGEPPVEDAPTKKRFVRVAVYELVATDYPDRVPRIVTQALLAEIRKLDGVAVAGVDEIKAMIDVEANRQLAGCGVDASCLADIAGALGADVVVMGNLAHVGDATVFAARRLDQKSAQATAQVDQRLVDAGGEEYIAAVGTVVEKLFPQSEFPLRAGMKRGADPQLALRVHPPPLAPWVFYTTAAGAVVAGGAAVVASGVNASAANHYAGVTTPVQGRDVVANAALTKDTAIGAWAGLGVFVVAGAGATVEALFTDWWGYGAGPTSAAE